MVRDGGSGPFVDFMRRPLWPAILVFVVGYKLGEAMAGVMAMPLYISIGFSLDEIAAVSKLVGFVATIVGAIVGGVVATRFGLMRALLLCGVLQSAGNLFYVLQAVGGHRIGYLALCVAAENVTGAMAGAALVAYLSGLCSPAFTATQYALLSSLAAVGRTLVASSGGVLASAARLGAVLPADHGRDGASTGAAGLDRAAHRRAIRTSGTHARRNWLVNLLSDSLFEPVLRTAVTKTP